MGGAQEAKAPKNVVEQLMSAQPHITTAKQELTKKEWSTERDIRRDVMEGQYEMCYVGIKDDDSERFLALHHSGDGTKIVPDLHKKKRAGQGTKTVY